MKKTNTFSPPMVGGSSLLVIFGVLCLIIFTLLALGTVRADSRLSDASAQSVQAYYEADLQAQTIFAQLRAGQLPEGVTRQDTVYCYRCPISDTQELVVELENRDGTWSVLRYQSVSTLQVGPTW